MLTVDDLRQWVAFHEDQTRARPEGCDPLVAPELLSSLEAILQDRLASGPIGLQVQVALAVIERARS